MNPNAQNKMLAALKLARAYIVGGPAPERDVVFAAVADAIAEAERPNIHIVARRWFQRGAGNTYHSVRIYRGGEELAYLPFSYGYGEQWLQTAIDWLRANGHAPADAEYGTLYLRETLGGTYHVTDETRRRDL
jgi:hypothetical protein